MNIGLTDGLIMFYSDKKIKYGIILGSVLQCLDAESKTLVEQHGIEIIKFLPMANVETILLQKIQEILNMPIGVEHNILSQIQLLTEENKQLKEKLNSQIQLLTEENKQLKEKLTLQRVQPPLLENRFLNKATELIKAGESK